MDLIRKKRLESNFPKMFWIQAFFSFNIINAISTLFYLARGITLSEVFILAIVFGVASLIFEIPSSYMADRFGRKKTLILSLFFSLLHWIPYLFADSFLWFAIGITFGSMGYAFMSGTDYALIYDTNRELGRDKESLKKTANYHSAKFFLKIVAPIIAVLIAKDLLEWQFQIVLWISIAASSIGLLICLFLTEPNHYMDLEEKEAGIIKDAINLIKGNRDLLFGSFSKVMIFIASFMIWRFHQEYFVDAGVSVIMIGIAMSTYSLFNFILPRKIQKLLPEKSLGINIDWINILFTFVLFMMSGLAFAEVNIYLMLLIFVVAMVVVNLSVPLYFDFFNKISSSYNRATTLSLVNFVHSIMDIPLLLTAAYLVAFDMKYVMVFAFVVSLFVCVFLRLRLFTNK